MNMCAATNKKYTKRNASSNSNSNEVVTRKKAFHVGGSISGTTKEMTQS
jgi:hypothetical protein